MNFTDDALNRYLNKISNLIVSNKFDDALILLEEAINIYPSNLTFLRMKAMIYFEINELSKSISIINKAIDIDPKSIYLYHDLSSVYFKMEDYKSALDAIEKALALDNLNPDIVIGYALTLKYLERKDDAINILNNFLSINPSNTHALNILAGIYSSIMKVQEAIKCLKKAIEYDPKNYKSLLKLAEVLRSCIYINDKDSMDLSYKCITNIPKDAPYLDIVAASILTLLRFLDLDKYDDLGTFNMQLNALSKNDLLISIIFIMSRVVSMQDRLDLKEAFKNWGNNISNSVYRQIELPKRNKKHKKIRLGIACTFIGSDHVFNFIYPILEHIDSNKFELYIYSFSKPNNECSVYPLIKEKSNKVVCFDVNLPSHYYAENIIKDELDVFIETGIAFSDPRVLAHRLSPIQISWLDCPHSLGLFSDYILLDPYVNPGEEWLLEKPLVLKNTWVAIDEKRFTKNTYRTDIPEDRNGYVTFGTMNSTFKITRETFRVWAGVMHKVPGSRFLYVRPETASDVFKNNFCKYMEEYGINRDRISFFSTRTDHMDQYHNIDISLDVFPHTGGTTTCESLWMGVPVITLVGTCFFERLSYSNLSNVGLSDLCAFKIVDYQKKAIDLAFNKDRRRILKKTLRQRILDYPLGKPAEFVKDLEDAIIKLTCKTW